MLLNSFFFKLQVQLTEPFLKILLENEKPITLSMTTITLS